MIVVNAEISHIYNRQENSAIGENVEVGNDVTSEKNLNKKESSNQEDIAGAKNQNKCYNMNKKAKIFTIVTTIAALIVVAGLAIGLYFAFKFRLEVKDQKYVTFEDNSVMKLTQINILERRLFEPNLIFNLTKSEVVSDQNSNNSMQQASQKEFISTVTFEKQGVIAQVYSNSSVKIMVNFDAMINYLQESDEQFRRLLQQTPHNQSDSEYNESDIEEFKAELQRSLSEQFNDGKAVEIAESILVSFEYNQEQNQFVESSNKDKIRVRLLGQRRKLFFAALFNGIGNLFRTIVQPVVQVVRNYGPYIGGVVGGVVGFVTGGPAGAFSGWQTGYSIGSYAQQAINACIPRNSLRISCDSRAVVSLGVDIAIDVGKPYFSSSGSGSTRRSNRKNSWI